MNNPFTKHPDSVGETYIKHLCFATKTGLKLVWAGTMILIHAVCPFLFVNTGSKFIENMAKNLVARREGNDD